MKKILPLLLAFLMIFTTACSMSAQDERPSSDPSDAVENLSADSSPQSEDSRQSLTESVSSATENSVQSQSSESVVVPEPEPQPTTLFSVSDMNISIGETQRIVPVSNSTAVSYSDIKYEVLSGNELISITDDGYVTANHAGTVQIRAYINGRQDKFRNFEISVTGQEGLYRLNNYVYADHKGGVYNSTFNLNLYPADENYQIYYTTDCTIPTNQSTRYTGAIPITNKTYTGNYQLTRAVKGDPTGTGNSDKCISYDYLNNIEWRNNYPKISMGTVITFAVYSGNTLLDTQAVTYVVNANKDLNLSTVPVISLSMPYDNWFGTNGIYNDIYGELKPRVNLEYYDSTTNESFAYNATVKLSGGWTKGYPQKTWNVNFNKDEYGNKNTPTNVSIFGMQTQEGNANNLLAGLTRIRLHNGGNAFENWTHFNDALMQGIMEGGNTSTASYRPCIVYINGEFWGYYAIREHYSDTYFADNYGVKKSDVVYYDYGGGIWNLEEGDETQSPTLLNQLMTFLENTDTSIDTNYNTLITRYIEKDSFIDALLAEVFANNWDYVGNWNNFRMWRTLTAKNKSYSDGRWRACLHDVDFALNNLYGNYLVPKEYYAYDDSYADQESTLCSRYSYDGFIIYSKLLDNANFKRDLCARAIELCETNFSYENTNALLTKMADGLRPLLSAHVTRWGMGYSVSDWESYIVTTRALLAQRPAIFLRTTLAICGELPQNDSTVYSTVNTNSSNRDYTEQVNVNSSDFEIEYYMKINSFNNKVSGLEYKCRAGIVFFTDSGEFKFTFDPSKWSNLWLGSASFTTGEDVIKYDYINVGIHKYKFTIKNGVGTVVIDDDFTRTFNINLSSSSGGFGPGGQQWKNITVNYVKFYTTLAQADVNSVVITTHN